MIGYFVTGTDTDVGKTYVGCTLARRAVSRGHKVFAFKPAETGCRRTADGSYRGEDQDLLAVAAGDWQTGALRGLYRFPLPAAPLVAAVHAESAIDLDLIERTARTGAAAGNATFAIVEGAGGWRVPITPQADMATLAHRLGFPVLIVARAGLGTINHSLLSIEAVERDACQVAGLVLSHRPSDDPAFTQSNRDEIARRWSGPIVVLGNDPAVLDRLIPDPR
jgi:dethiobiotin synthetase